MGTEQEVMPEYGPTNPSPEEKDKNRVKRFGSVIGLKPEKEQYYRKLHADTWSSVVERLKRSNMQNFSIYVTELEGMKYLFNLLLWYSRTMIGNFNNNL